MEVPDVVFKKHREAMEYARENGSAHVEIAHSHVVEDLRNALHNTNSITEKILARLPHSSAEFYLTGADNFRHNICTIQKYKGNRDDVARPVHLPAVRNHLVAKYRASVISGMEADDMLGIRATELAQEGHSPVIVSIDKDLRMLPCKHYNFVTDVFDEVDDLAAYRNFYSQLLTGDRTDWIKGIEGVGPKTAFDILKDCNSPEAMLQAVRKAYADKYGKAYPREDGTFMNIDDAISETGALLWMKRSRDEPLWDVHTPL